MNYFDASRNSAWLQGAVTEVLQKAAKVRQASHSHMVIVVFPDKSLFLSKGKILLFQESFFKYTGFDLIPRYLRMACIKVYFDLPTDDREAIERMKSAFLLEEFRTELAELGITYIQFGSDIVYSA